MILYMQEGLVDYVFFVMRSACAVIVKYPGMGIQWRPGMRFQGAWMSKIKTPAGLMFDKSCSLLPHLGTAEPGSHKGKALWHSRLVKKSISTDCQDTNLAQRILPLPAETSTEQLYIQLWPDGILVVSVAKDNHSKNSLCNFFCFTFSMSCLPLPPWVHLWPSHNSPGYTYFRSPLFCHF